MQVSSSTSTVPNEHDYAETRKTPSELKSENDRAKAVLDLKLNRKEASIKEKFNQKCTELEEEYKKEKEKLDAEFETKRQQYHLRLEKLIAEVEHCIRELKKEDEYNTRN